MACTGNEQIENIPPIPNPNDGVDVYVGACVAYDNWFTTEAVPKLNEMYPCINGWYGTVRDTKIEIDEIKTEIDTNLEAIKALCGSAWAGNWNDEDDFAGKSVLHNGKVWGSLISPPTTQINDEPTEANANWKRLSFELKDDVTPELGADLECLDKTFNTSSYRQIPDMDSTATTSLDFNLGDMVKLTLVGDTTLTFDNFVNVSVMWVDLVGGGDYAITYPVGTRFVGGRLPILSTGTAIDRLQIERGGDGTFTVFVLGKDLKVVT